MLCIPIFQVCLHFKCPATLENEKQVALVFLFDQARNFIQNCKVVERREKAYGRGEGGGGGG